MTKKLYRNTDEKICAGILSGLAEHQNTDVVIWRLGFVALLIMTGLMPGIFLYVVAWVIIPEKPVSGVVEEKGFTSVL